MPDPVNLKVPGEIAAVIDGVALRGHPLALARVGADGSPSVSFQGSAYVRSSTELVFWSRTRNRRLAAEIADRRRVSLTLFETDGPGARFLAIEGGARLAPELDDEVYAAIDEGERELHSERRGGAVDRRSRQWGRDQQGRLLPAKAATDSARDRVRRRFPSARCPTRNRVINAPQQRSTLMTRKDWS